MAKKPKKVATPEEPPQSAKQKKSKSQSPAPESSAQKPQRGLAIGDNFGWTGKLPATLLFEHAQKQKWNKVIIDMRKTAKGFIGVVNLLWENPKTRETIHLKWQPETELLTPRETTNEARHFAATYALYRINYVKNMKMVLPNLFRNYWSDMEAKRIEVLKRDKEFHDKIYNANPFQVHLDSLAAQELKEREKKAKDNNDAKIRKPVASVRLEEPKLIKTAQSKSIKSGLLIKSFPIGKKAWENAPFIDISPEIRASIENSIKRHIFWVEENDKAVADKSLRQLWLSQLSLIGFREMHAEEALKYTNTFIDALEWLLFHIPEDDLPEFFAKRDEDSSLSFKISTNIKTENMLKRLSLSGYDKDEIMAILKKTDYNEHLTAVALTHKIVGLSSIEEQTSEESLDLWIDELESIVAIGSNKVDYVSETKDIAMLRLNVPGISVGMLLVKLFLPCDYPNSFPGVHIVVNDQSFKLANYIKLSIIRHLYAYLSSNNFFGECYLYSLTEWLEKNITSIIKNPGTLVVNSALQEKKCPEAFSKSTTLHFKKKSRIDYVLQEDVKKIRLAYSERQDSKALRDSIERRKKLPAWQKKEELVNVIFSNKVTLVTGETGSGKSTQIVQFVLDELSQKGNFESKIICTQPRRISTIGLAERISEERCLKLGEETGYVIRGENVTLNQTRLLLVTTGILLRMLQAYLNPTTNASSMFDNLEFIFIDEVHERSVDSDFLLNILKKIIGKLPKLKIVLMSATINPEIFIKYFPMKVNTIHIEGRTFPIQDVYLDAILSDLDYSMSTYDDQVIKPKADSQFFKSGKLNYDLIAKLCAFIDKKLQSEGNKGSILVFLPGIMEINQCIKKIEEQFRKECQKLWCLPLHSALSSKDQKRVFQMAPYGSRKIVVSTNIAETSITIPDCVVVVEAGKSKSVFFDPQANTTRLVENWCSRAEMAQRRGRSGRIQSGTCYHLYTKETESSVLAQPIPEIRRTRLENLFLVIKAMGIKNVSEFLRDGLDPPEEQSLDKAKSLLEEIGALETDGSLSHLGKYLSLIPTDLQVGKLLILGCIFGCVELCLTLAAVCSSGSPFSNNFEIKDEVKRAKNSLSKGHGDLMASVFAYREWENLPKNETKKFVSDNFLSYLTLQDIRSNRTQYLLTLREIGFLPFSYKAESSQKLNRNNENYILIRAIITGSFTPQLARVQLPDPKYAQTLVGAVEIDPDAKQTKFWIRNEKYIEQVNLSKQGDELPASRAFIHPSSILFSAPEPGIDASSLEDLRLEDGLLDVQKVRENFDLVPSAKINSNAMHKAPFVVYSSANFTSKLFLRDITPTSTLSALLLGGKILYDIAGSVSTGRRCPGIVLDLWMPIRTWCKNGVLLKRMRNLLDHVIENKLSNPNHEQAESDDDEVLNIIINILRSELRLT